jgi:hypothetical protein
MNSVKMWIGILGVAAVFAVMSYWAFRLFQGA